MKSVGIDRIGPPDTLSEQALAKCEPVIGLLRLSRSVGAKSGR